MCLLAFRFSSFRLFRECEEEEKAEGRWRMEEKRDAGKTEGRQWETTFGDKDERRWKLYLMHWNALTRKNTSYLPPLLAFSFRSTFSLPFSRSGFKQTDFRPLKLDRRRRLLLPCLSFPNAFFSQRPKFNFSPKRSTDQSFPTNFLLFWKIYKIFITPFPNWSGSFCESPSWIIHNFIPSHSLPISQNGVSSSLRHQRSPF